MSFRMKYPRNVFSELQRVIVEEIDRAQKDLEAEPVEFEEGIYEARKRFKKIRATLRLISGSLGKTFATENRFYRDIGRSLSQVRDSQAMLEIFGKLKGRFQLASSPHTVNEMQRWLQRRKKKSGVKWEELKLRVDDWKEDLAKARKRTVSWSVSEEGFLLIAEGLESVYRAGRGAMVLAYESDRSERFHEWRKRVKDHWCHVCLVRDAWPVVLQGRRRALRELSKHLGDDHDLTLFQAMIRKEGKEWMEPEVFARITEEIQEMRGELRLRSALLGRRVYAEKPGAFRKRMEQLWEAWTDEILHPPAKGQGGVPFSGSD